MLVLKYNLKCQKNSSFEVLVLFIFSRPHLSKIGSCSYFKVLVRGSRMKQTVRVSLENILARHNTWPEYRDEYERRRGIKDIKSNVYFKFN